MDIGQRHYPRSYLQKPIFVTTLGLSKTKTMEKWHKGSQWAASPGTSTCWAQQYAGVNNKYIRPFSHHVCYLIYINYIVYFICSPRSFLFTQCGPAKSKGWTPKCHVCLPAGQRRAVGQGYCSTEAERKLGCHEVFTLYRNSLRQFYHRN